MTYYYFLFTIFAIVMTMMIIDNNVSVYIHLLSRLVKNKFDRFYWIIRFHPMVMNNFIFKWWMMRKYMLIAKQLKEDFENDNQKF